MTSSQSSGVNRVTSYTRRTYPISRFPVVAANAFVAQWRSAREPERQDINPDLSYAKCTAVRPYDGKQVTAHLTFFASRALRLEVIDLGVGPESAFPTLADPFRAAGCIGASIHQGIRFETQLVGLGYGLTGSLAPRMAPWSLKGRIHGVPRQPVPEPSPATEPQR